MNPELFGERKGGLAFLAAEHVISANGHPGGVSSGHVTRADTAFNRANGALEISPDLDLKIRKALQRQVRRMKFRLYLSLLRLYFTKFALQIRGAILRS